MLRKKIVHCLQSATTHSLVKISKSHQKMEDTEASSIRDLPLDNHRGQTRKCILSVVLVLLALILAAVISAVVMKANEEDLDQPKQKTLVIKIPQSK